MYCFIVRPQCTDYFFAAVTAATARISRVDPAHGCSLEARIRMGRPVSPTAAQERERRDAASVTPPEIVPIAQGRLSFTLPAPGLALVEIAEK